MSDTPVLNDFSLTEETFKSVLKVMSSFTYFNHFSPSYFSSIGSNKSLEVEVQSGNAIDKSVYLERKIFYGCIELLKTIIPSLDKNTTMNLDTQINDTTKTTSVKNADGTTSIKYDTIKYDYLPIYNLSIKYDSISVQSDQKLRAILSYVKNYMEDDSLQNYSVVNVFKEFYAFYNGLQYDDRAYINYVIQNLILDAKKSNPNLSLIADKFINNNNKDQIHDDLCMYSVLYAHNINTILDNMKMTLTGLNFYTSFVSTEPGKNALLSTTLKSYRHGCCSGVYNGLMYIFGGRYANTTSLTVETYNPINGIETLLGTTNNLQLLRQFGCSATYNNKEYFFGGVTMVGGYTHQSGIDCFDYNTSTSTLMNAVLNVPRIYAQAVTYKDKIYIIGGVQYVPVVNATTGVTSYSAVYLNSIEVYDPVADTCTLLVSPVLTALKHAHSATLYKDKVYIIGGQTPSGIINTIEVFDPVANTCTVLSGVTLNVLRRDHQAVTYNDKIYIIGGYNYAGGISSIECFNPATNTCVTIKNQMNMIRTAFMAELINDVIYIAGGSSLISLLINIETLSFNSSFTDDYINVVDTTSQNSLNVKHNTIFKLCYLTILLTIAFISEYDIFTTSFKKSRGNLYERSTR